MRLIAAGRELDMHLQVTDSSVGWLRRCDGRKENPRREGLTEWNKWGQAYKQLKENISSPQCTLKGKRSKLIKEASLL